MFFGMSKKQLLVTALVAVASIAIVKKVPAINKYVGL